MQVYLAQNIKFLRKRMGKSQDQLATALTISRNKVATYENGISEPRLDLLPKLAVLFKITIDDLLNKVVNDNNIDSCTATYVHKKGRSTAADNPGIPLNIDNDEAISLFVEKNINLEKMIHGFKAYHELQSTNDPQNPDIQHLISILEHLLTTNQSLIVELKSINK